MIKLPILVSVPHGGIRVPPEVKDRVMLDKDDLFEVSDAFARDLFDFSDHVAFWKAAVISPAVVDVDRPREELPDVYPDGVIKHTTGSGLAVYQPGTEPDAWLIRELLRNYYDRYHRELVRFMVQRDVLVAVNCRIIGENRPVEPGKGPLICLGDAHGKACPSILTRKLAAACRESFNFTTEQVAINNPLSGGHIVRTYGSRPVPWVEIGLHRSLYLRKPWFDWRSRQIDPDRLAELKKFLLQALYLWVERFTQENFRRNTGLVTI